MRLLLTGTVLAFGMLAAVNPQDAQAAPWVLTTGAGDGSVTLGVDGFGAFGSSVGADSTNAVFDPFGPTGPAGTVFESGVAIGFIPVVIGDRQFLTSGDIGGSGGRPNPTVTGNSTAANSSFALGGGLQVSLLQLLTPVFTGVDLTGAILSQIYVITNGAASTRNIDLVRYVDGDLLFDGSIADGGGRLTGGGTDVLFETDSATGAFTPTNFVGITAQGGFGGHFEIDSFSGLRARILAQATLDDLIFGDGDADGFIDAGNGYDVSLALSRRFVIGAGQSATFRTNTLFGSGTPRRAVVPEPGTFALFGLGGLGLVLLRRRRRAAVTTTASQE